MNRPSKALMLAVAVALGGTAQASAEVVLRYAHVGAPGETQTRYVEELAKLVSEKTEGRVEIEIYPGSQLGNTQEMIDSVRNGSIAMAQHDFSSLIRFDPDVAVFNAPFIYRSPEHAMKATSPATSPLVEEFNERLVENGDMRIVANFYRGARQLTMSEPVKSPDDLEGKKVRVPTHELWVSMVKGMGAIPTPIEITEVMPALVTGLADGQENPLNNIIAQKFYEPNPYIMMTSHMESVIAVFINEPTWQSVPEEDRGLMNEAFAEMAERTLEWERAALAENIKLLESQGVTFVTEDDGLDLEAFRKDVNAQILADYPSWGSYIERLTAVQ
jgi:tripartite ATP-independent transporter DctP family solute receptor